MYSEKQVIRLLRRNLESECSIIQFYLDNLEKLNYAKNKKAVDELIFGSCRHSRLLIKGILELGKKTSGKVSELVLNEAYREETAVKEIYSYQLARIEDSKVRKILKQLIKEETDHEKLVKSLK